MGLRRNLRLQEVLASLPLSPILSSTESILAPRYVTPAKLRTAHPCVAHRVFLPLSTRSGCTSACGCACVCAGRHAQVVIRALEAVSALQGEREVGLTGVWVAGAKVAAIGVRAKQ
jgi:hypothetical protein